MIISLLYSVYFRFNEYSYKFKVLEIHYRNLCVWFDWWNLKIIKAYLWILRLVTSMILQANPSLNLTWLVFFRHWTASKWYFHAWFFDYQVFTNSHIQEAGCSREKGKVTDSWFVFVCIETGQDFCSGHWFLLPCHRRSPGLGLLEQDAKGQEGRWGWVQNARLLKPGQDICPTGGV